MHPDNSWKVLSKAIGRNLIRPNLWSQQDAIRSGEFSVHWDLEQGSHPKNKVEFHDFSMTFHDVFMKFPW